MYDGHCIDVFIEIFIEICMQRLEEDLTDLANEELLVPQQLKTGNPQDHLPHI